MSKKNKGVVVLGCPRSGTSLLTQLIAKAGYNVDGGGTKQLMRPNPAYNPDGYYERIDIVKTNDWLITQIDLKYNFLNSPTIKEIEKFKLTNSTDSFRDIKNELTNSNGWIIKDSRLAFTLHLYELKDICGIKITRTPEDVKKSMVNHYGDLFTKTVRHGPHEVQKIDFVEYYTNINTCIDWQFNSMPHITITYEDLLTNNFESVEKFLNCKLDKTVVKTNYRKYGM